MSCLQRAGIQSCSLKVKLESRQIGAKIHNMPPLRPIRTPGSTRPNSNVTHYGLALSKKEMCSSKEGQPWYINKENRECPLGTAPPPGEELARIAGMSGPSSQQLV